MSESKVIVVQWCETLRLTVPGAEGRECVYVDLKNGKLVFTGGANIIEKIVGEGMEEKVSRY